MVELKFSFEYFCSPIWIKDIEVRDSIFENILIDEISLLSEELMLQIKLLDSIFQGTYNDDYPPEAIWQNVDYEISFYEKALELSDLLCDELSKYYIVVVDKEQWQNRIRELNGQ